MCKQPTCCLAKCSQFEVGSRSADSDADLDSVPEIVGGGGGGGNKTSQMSVCVWDGCTQNLPCCDGTMSYIAI